MYSVDVAGRRRRRVSHDNELAVNYNSLGAIAREPSPPVFVNIHYEMSRAKPGLVLRASRLKSRLKIRPVTIFETVIWVWVSCYIIILLKGTYSYFCS